MGSSRIPFAVGACVRLVEFPDLVSTTDWIFASIVVTMLLPFVRLLDRFLKIIIRIQIAELTPVDAV